MTVIFDNNTTGSVTNGGTDAPASGTSESWTVSTSTFPASLSGSQYFHVADPAALTEKIKVTGISGSGPYVWTVTRGDESTTPVTHISDFTVQQVVTAGDFGTFATSASSSVYVYPSGDTTGATDAANINNAISALPTVGGVKVGTIFLAPTAVWHIECGVVTHNGTGVYINGSGCYIYAVGAGDMIRMYDSSNYNTRPVPAGGGLIGMPFIDGTNTTGNSTAFHAGDIPQLAVFAQVMNFHAGTTSKGIWLDNNYYWTEQAYGRIYASSCTTCVMFDNSANTSGDATGSFDRMIFDIFIEPNSIGDGVTLNNSAFSIGGRLGIYGNMAPSSNSTVYYCLKFLDYSYLQNMILDIDVELDGSGGTTPSTILFTASPYNYIQNCTGFIDFGAASPFTTAPHNSGNFQFAGPVIGDATLQSMSCVAPSSVNTAVTGNGQTFYCNFNSLVFLTGTTSYTGLILYGGGFTGQQVTLINTGTGTFTFAAAATSHVAQGTSVSLAPGASRLFTWNNTTSLWY